jgi:citrate lyase beta subunit
VTVALQLIVVQKPALTARQVRASANTGATIVLDLEDGLWDVPDDLRTAGMKAAAREQLAELAANSSEMFVNQRIGVRLNRLSDAESAADLAALKETARRGVRLAAVVVTKVEGPSELRDWTRLLSENSVSYDLLIPIVETVAGLANLDEICAAALELRLPWIVYGHYDYAFDAGWWPFPDDRDPAYWQHVEPIIQRIEAAGLGYIQPPFFRLRRLDEFAALLGRLAGTCRRQFGVLTFGRHQTAVAAGTEQPPVLSEPRSNPPASDHRARARALIATFEAHRRPSASFAVDPSTGEFIAPHIYLAARRFLQDG